MVDVNRFRTELEHLEKALLKAQRVLVTAPGVADGDSIGAQLALRRMLMARYPNLEICILNDEPLAERYLFLPDVEFVYTPETISAEKNMAFDVAIVVDGGVDRAGRVKKIFDQVKTRVFIDHHAVSAEYPYEIKIVEPTASSTTELMYHLSQTHFFKFKVNDEFSQQIYLGLIFDTGFFRHSNTTPEVMELAAQLLRSDFDFTRVGERGMLERSFSSLKLLSDTLSRAELKAEGKIIYSTLSQANLKAFDAQDDDREGIIDHLFLTRGIEVALLFFELPQGRTKVSLRSQGEVDVAAFARSLTEQGGGHVKAAGANLAMTLDKAVSLVLERLEATLTERPKARAAKH